MKILQAYGSIKLQSFQLHHLKMLSCEPVRLDVVFEVFVDHRHVEIQQLKRCVEKRHVEK